MKAGFCIVVFIVLFNGLYGIKEDEQEDFFVNEIQRAVKELKYDQKATLTKEEVREILLYTMIANHKDNVDNHQVDEKEKEKRIQTFNKLADAVVKDMKPVIPTKKLMAHIALNSVSLDFNKILGKSEETNEAKESDL